MIFPDIRAVFFDAVGTLIHPEPAPAVIYAEVGRRFGSKHAVEAIQTRFAAAFAREEAADRAGNLRTSEERERQRWRNIVGMVLDDVGDPEGCFRELYEHFARPQAWRIEPQAAAVIEQLAGRGLRLGLASNFDHRLHPVAAGFPALWPLSHVVISSEVGWRKPAPEFFAALCRSSGVAAEQACHIGDDPANDYEGATAAGLNAMLLDTKGKHSSFAGHRLQRLAQVIRLLSGGEPQ
jgi:putative hydrolase of the HAD superfamily